MLSSSSVHAEPITDAFVGGLININNFFVNEQFAPYSGAIDFFFFGLLFTAIYMMGARYAFKEIKSAEKTIVIVLGLATAVLLVLGGFSLTFFLPYIFWVLIFLLFLFWWLVLKGIENKFWRFLLALLLTILTLLLAQGLYSYIIKPDASVGLPDISDAGGISGFFRDLGSSFDGIDLGVNRPTLPDWLGGVGIGGGSDGGGTLADPIGPEDIPEEAGPGLFSRLGKYWWLLLLLLLLALAIWQWDKIKGLRSGGGNGRADGPTTSGSEDEDARHKREKRIIEELIAEIEKIILQKKKIVDDIAEIIARKRKATLNFWDAYHKKINDPAFMMDPEADEHKKLMSQQDEVTKLLKLELKLEKDLIALRKTEESLLTLRNIDTIREELDIRGVKKGKILEWGAKISDIYASSADAFMAAPKWYIEALGKLSYSLMFLDPIVMRVLSLPNRFPSLRNSVPKKGLVEEVKSVTIEHFLITKSQRETEKKLKKLTEFKAVEEWIREGKYERWRDMQKMLAQELKLHFEEEERKFYEDIPEINPTTRISPMTGKPDPWVIDPATGQVVFKSRGALKPLINRQMRYMQYIVQLLKYLESNRKSFTQMQELYVAVQDANDPNKWDDVDPSSYLDPETNIVYSYPSHLNPDNENDAAVLRRLIMVFNLNRQPIKVYTNFAEGIPPFKVSCYVDNAKKAESIVREKSAVEPVVSFFTNPIPPGKHFGEHEIGQLTPGSHQISVLAISPRDTFRRVSKRTIVVNVGMGTPKPKKVAPYHLPFKIFDQKAAKPVNKNKIPIRDVVDIYHLAYKIFDHKAAKPVNKNKIPIRDVVAIKATVLDKNNNKIRGIAGKIKIKCTGSNEHGASLLKLENGIVKPTNDLELEIDDKGNCFFNYMVGKKAGFKHAIRLEATDSNRAIKFIDNKLELKIKTINRTDLTNNKEVISVLKVVKNSGRRAFKRAKPRIPTPWIFKKSGEDVDLSSAREMYNKLGYHIVKNKGLFVIFEWDNVEVWDDNNIIVNGGYIHSGNEEEGFIEIQPWEYVKINLILARKAMLSSKLSRIASEDYEELSEDDVEAGEDGILRPTIEIDDSNEMVEVPRGYVRTKSYKLFMLLNLLEYQCKENLMFRLNEVYTRLFKFVSKLGLLLMSSITSREISGDKWNTHKALIDTTMYKKWKLPYYIPYTVLASDVLDDPSVLDKIEESVLSKFKDNQIWNKNKKKFVVKPRVGSQGSGIEFFNDKTKCLEFLRRILKPEIYIVQEYILLKDIEGYSFDFRILITGRKIGLIYERRALDEKSDLANISKGGEAILIREGTQLYQELEEVTQYLVKHFASANLRWAGLYDMIRDYVNSKASIDMGRTAQFKHIKESEDLRKELFSIAWKFKTLYQSAWEFFGLDVGKSNWNGKDQFVFIEVNTTPGLKGVQQNGMMDALMLQISINLINYSRQYHHR